MLAFYITALTIASVAAALHFALELQGTEILAPVLLCGFAIGAAVARYVPDWHSGDGAEGLDGLIQRLSRNGSPYLHEIDEVADEGVLLLDDQACVAYADARVEQWLGQASTALRGRLVDDLFTVRKDVPRLDSRQFAHTLQFGLPQWGELRMRGGADSAWRARYVCAPVHRGERLEGGWLLLKEIPRSRPESVAHQADAVFNSTVEGIIIADADGDILSVNPAFSEITGYAPEEVIGKNPRILSSGIQDVEFYQRMWQQVNESGRWRGEVQNRHKDGHVYAELLTVSAVRGADGVMRNYVGVFNDLTKIKEAQSELLHLAHHDPLTGLPNRVLFNDRLATALKSANRHASRVGVLFLDLDGFKVVNDSMGHPVGDELLKQVAGRLQGGMREMDILARVGGDEFVVILESIDNADDAAIVARKLLNSLEPTFELEGNAVSISASIGVAMYPDDGMDSATLTKNADAAMYRAKETGRGRFVFYSSGLTDCAMEKIRISADLAHAAALNQFHVVYQPQYGVACGRLTGVEALLRWRHPDLGDLMPERFIGIAEENHRILAIGEWVLESACRDLAALERAGFDDLRLCVNLSAVQMRQRHFVDDVKRILQSAGINPRSLELELTESAVMQQPEQAARALHRLRALGIRLSIDNFGSGASSLGFLKELPIDRLKIDRSLLTGVPRDQGNVAICKAIVALAHNLRLAVTAEGVESPLQREFVSQLKCDEAQGFHTGRPMELAQLLDLLKDERIGKPIGAD